MSELATRRKKKSYTIEPNQDMTGFGWRKELTYKYIIQDEKTGKAIVTEVDYSTAKRLNCDCKTNEFLWLIPQRTGVYVGCCQCKTVSGPLSEEHGDVIERKEISPLEALRIMEARGEKIPQWLAKQVGIVGRKGLRKSRPKESF